MEGRDRCKSDQDRDRQWAGRLLGRELFLLDGAIRNLPVNQFETDGVRYKRPTDAKSKKTSSGKKETKGTISLM